MDDNSIKTQPQTDSHITKEMYKKNLELAERNKILTLLRKIDEIILSTVTKVDQIADQIVQCIISNSYFKTVFIYVIDEKEGVLKPLAVGLKKTSILLDDNITHIYYNGVISISQIDNPLIKATKEGKMIESIALSSFMSPPLTQETANETQKSLGIQKFIIHPFYMRNKPAGVIIFGLGEDQISYPYWNDLIVRLPEVVSIAIDNALLYQQIEKDNEQLKELDRLKDEFVSVASHELRTPMTAIKSYLWMALNKSTKELDPQVKQEIEIAYGSTERLLKLVQDMLTISRIEGKRLQLQKEEFNFNEITQQAYDELKITAKEKGIVFNFNISEKPIIIIGDKEKLSEVLQNIIGNALKFTPVKGAISLSINEDEKYLTIDVVNTGSFIPQEELPKLFQKFNRLNIEATNKEGASMGTGLGLYITKQIVEMHNGTIDVTSDETEGTTFHVKIPKRSN
jgi:signal transduction histidine kinase